MRDSKAGCQLTGPKRQMRQLMHEIANSLHLLGLKTELARAHLASGDRDAASAAMEAVIRERDNCRRMTQEIRRHLRDVE